MAATAAKSIFFNMVFLLGGSIAMPQGRNDRWRVSHHYQSRAELRQPEHASACGGAIPREPLPEVLDDDS